MPNLGPFCKTTGLVSENISVLKEKQKAGDLIYIKRRKRPQWPQHTPDLRSGCPAPSPHAKKDTTTQPGKNEYGLHIQFFQNKVGGKSNKSVFKGWKPVGLFSRRRRISIRSYKPLALRPNRRSSGPLMWVLTRRRGLCGVWAMSRIPEATGPEN